MDMTNYTPKEILNAIDECRVNWCNMKANRKCGEKPNCDGCALCRMFVDNPNHKSCKGCPIKEKTGEHLCRGTPFGKAWLAFHIGTDEEWNAASQEMIDFLDATRKEFVNMFNLTKGSM
jgi:hypothetical protein